MVRKNSSKNLQKIDYENLKIANEIIKIFKSIKESCF